MTAAADPTLVASLVEALVAAGIANKPPEPPSPRPTTATEDGVALNIEDAIGWIENARRRMDDLIFSLQDATSPDPDYSKEKLRASAYEDGVEGLRALRYALEEIHAVRGKLVLRRGR